MKLPNVELRLVGRERPKIAQRRKDSVELHRNRSRPPKLGTQHAPKLWPHNPTFGRTPPNPQVWSVPPPVGGLTQCRVWSSAVGAGLDGPPRRRTPERNGSGQDFTQRALLHPPLSPVLPKSAGPLALGRMGPAPGVPAARGRRAHAAAQHLQAFPRGLSAASGGAPAWLKMFPSP